MGPPAQLVLYKRDRLGATWLSSRSRNARIRRQPGARPTRGCSLAPSCRSLAPRRAGRRVPSRGPSLPPSPSPTALASSASKPQPPCLRLPRRKRIGVATPSPLLHLVPLPPSPASFLFPPASAPCPPSTHPPPLSPCHSSTRRRRWRPGLPSPNPSSSPSLPPRPSSHPSVAVLSPSVTAPPLHSWSFRGGRIQRRRSRQGSGPRRRWLQMDKTAHLLFVGRPGSEKKTLIMALIGKIFGTGTEMVCRFFNSFLFFLLSEKKYDAGDRRPFSTGSRIWRDWFRRRLPPTRPDPQTSDQVLGCLPSPNPLRLHYCG